MSPVTGPSAVSGARARLLAGRVISAGCGSTTVPGSRGPDTLFRLTSVVTLTEGRRVHEPRVPGAPTGTCPKCNERSENDYNA